MCNILLIAELILSKGEKFFALTNLMMIKILNQLYNIFHHQTVNVLFQGKYLCDTIHLFIVV